jgi:hypothetical protein
MQICVIIYTHLAYKRMTEMMYMYVIPNFLMNSNGVFRQFTMPNSYFNMSINHSKGPNKKYSLYRVTRPYLKSSAYNSFFITFSQQALVRYLTHPPSLEM